MMIKARNIALGNDIRDALDPEQVEQKFGEKITSNIKTLLSKNRLHIKEHYNPHSLYAKKILLSGGIVIICILLYRHCSKDQSATKDKPKNVNSAEHSSAKHKEE